MEQVWKVGKSKGAVSTMKQVAENTTSSHCVNQRHCLATRKMSQDVEAVLDDAVKIFNQVWVARFKHAF